MIKYHKDRNEQCNDDTGPDYTFNDLYLVLTKLTSYPPKPEAKMLEIIEYLKIKYEDNGDMQCLDCMD